MGEIRSSRAGAVHVLELAHAGRANAIDAPMLSQLAQALDEVSHDSRVRVLLIRGTGGGTFSSGADIRAWAPMPPEEFARNWIAFGNAVFRRLEQLRCPTVAAIEGLCLGGGLELALCADLRLGSSAARLRFPELGIGAIPGWEGGPRLARIAGRGRALEAVLCAREIDAQTALQWGVLNAVWAPERFESELQAWLQRMCALSPRAASLARQAIVGEHGDSAAFHAAAGERIKGSADAAEGLMAFADRRAPSFRD